MLTKSTILPRNRFFAQFRTVPITCQTNIEGGALIELFNSIYFTVLAAADIVTCSMLLFSGLSRGVFWCKNGWLEFDAFVYLPVVSVSSNLTVWATMCVAGDRLAIVHR